MVQQCQTPNRSTGPEKEINQHRRVKKLESGKTERRVFFFLTQRRSTLPAVIAPPALPAQLTRKGGISPLGHCSRRWLSRVQKCGGRQRTKEEAREKKNNSRMTSVPWLRQTTAEKDPVRRRSGDGMCSAVQCRAEQCRTVYCGAEEEAHCCRDIRPLQPRPPPLSLVLCVQLSQGPPLSLRLYHSTRANNVTAPHCPMLSPVLPNCVAPPK